MRSARFLFALVLLGASSSLAGEDAFVANLSWFSGGRAGSGTTDSILYGGQASLGYRRAAWRVGAVARIGASRSYGSSPGYDLGGWGSVDLFSLWLDPQLALAVFLRIDGLARLVPSASSVGFVGYATAGLRVGGIELAYSGGPEIGLKLGPINDVAGGAFEFRIGVDVVELIHLIRHFCDAKRPQPP